MRDMSAFEMDFSEERRHRQDRGLWRELAVYEPEQGMEVVLEGKRLVNFSSNDYFGMTQHPEVIKAAQEAIATYGVGAGASRFVTGNHAYYDMLEAMLAEHYHTEAACVFGSGYMASIGVIPALVGKGDLVVSDKLAHACLLDGIKLSGAKHMRFHHNDMGSLNRILLRNHEFYDKCLIVTETVFSMDGDLAPLSDIGKLARKYDAAVMADNAHGFGLVPPSDAVDVHMGTLSKALGGYGGYVCGSEALVAHLHQKARSLVYTTALPPSVVAGNAQAIDCIVKDKALVENALKHAKAFTGALALPEAESLIVPVVIGGAEGAVNASEKLKDKGFLVSAIRPPTVPEGKARLRVTFSSLHTKEQVEALAKAVKEVM